MKETWEVDGGITNQARFLKSFCVKSFLWLVKTTSVLVKRYCLQYLYAFAILLQVTGEEMFTTQVLLDMCNHDNATIWVRVGKMLSTADPRLVKLHLLAQLFSSWHPGPPPKPNSEQGFKKVDIWLCRECPPALSVRGVSGGTGKTIFMLMS